MKNKGSITIGLVALIVSLVQLNLLVNDMGIRVKTTQPIQSQVAVKTFLPERIAIQKIGMNLPIVFAPIKNGSWDVIPSVANYAEGTSLVNPKEGNVGLFGHDREDSFRDIKKLLPGDKITLQVGDSQASYEVTSSAVIDPSTVSAFYPSKKPELTLVTCDGIFSQSRYMVKAAFKELTKII